MAAPPRLPLSERTRPASLDEVVGNTRARADLRAWAERWRSGVPSGVRAALMSGPPGVGKTSAALALAADLGWTVVEMNASDARNESAIERVAGRASITHTLEEPARGSGRRRALIVLDEADSLSGRATETARAVRAPPPLRDFLRGRYGTIEALNAAWGLTPTEKPLAFGSWDALPRSPGNFAWARRPAARKDLDEWRSVGRAPDASDRGGMGAIARLVRETRQPLVLIVNDDRVLTRYSAVFRNGVARIRFYPLSDRELATHLTGIARRERIALAPGALDLIVRRSRGDLRAALNDLEAVAPLPATEVQLRVLGFRDLTSDLEAVTAEVLTAARFYRSVEIRDRIDAPPDDLLPWIEENIPRFAPDPRHRAAAFDRLTVAEQLLGRARRWRVWGLWSYASEVLSGGVGLAIRDAPSATTVRAYFPGFLGAMGGSRATRAIRESVVGKAGARLHLSKAKSRETVLPFLEDLFGALRTPAGGTRRTALAAAVARELHLTAEEAGYLADLSPDSPAIERLLPAEPDDPEPVADEPPVGESPAEPPRRVQRRLSEFGARG
jgi:DNA polymerase III delta prime subunit